MDGAKQIKLTDQINLPCISCCNRSSLFRARSARTVFECNTEFVTPRPDPSLIQDGEAALGGCAKDDNAIWVERLDVDGLGIARKVRQKLKAARKQGEVGQGTRLVSLLAIPT